MADATAWTPLSGWTENGDGSWSQIPTTQTEPRLDGYLPIVGGTLAGLVVTVTPTAASAGFRLPHGAAPSSPTDGDVWTTTAGLYVRINGATVGPLGSGGGGGTPATTVTTLAGLQAPVVGTATNYAREDHKHAVINVVDLSSTQTVGGAKTFSSTLAASGIVRINGATTSAPLQVKVDTDTQIRHTNVGAVAILDATDLAGSAYRNLILAGAAVDLAVGGTSRLSVASTGAVSVQPQGAAGTVSLAVRRSTDTTPTANIQEWQNAAGTVLALVDKDGNFTVGASASNAGLTISNTSTNGANLKLVGNGGTTPNKSIRAQGGNLEFTDSGYTNTILTLGDTGILTGANVWKPVTGTTTKAPLQFTAGTNLTTAAGGAVEYDGDTAYLTPDGSAVGGRGVLTSSHLYALSAARNLTNGTGAQSIFGVGFTLAGSTSYLLEMEVAISCSGTTTAIKSLGFALGGTLTSIGFNLMYTHSATSVGTSAASNNLWVATNAATAMGATGTTNYTRISLRGVVRSNATGTFTPQITYSAAPGAAPAVQANSYITLTPIGNGTVQGVGAWA